MLRDERIADYLAGSMTAEQRAAFERDIVKDLEGLAELVGQQCVNAGLRALFDPDAHRVESAIMATVRSESEEVAANRILAETVGRQQKPRFDLRTIFNRLHPQYWQPWFVRLAFVCVIGAIGLGAWLLFRPATEGDDTASVEQQKPLNGFATVTGGAGIVWQNDDIGIGSSVAQGKLRLKSGIVGIQFTNGASIVLEGPAELELISPLKTALAFGKLTAHVPATAHGFSVEAGGNQITDLGTAFGISEPASGPMEVHVFTGKVDVTPKNSTVQELTEGKALRIAANATTPLAADRAEFVTETELQQRQMQEISARYEKWKKSNADLDRDPALLVHFDFEDARGSNLINRAVSTNRGTYGSISGCSWVEGRWASKGALQFSRRDERVRLKVPGQFESLTCAAWVSLDSLKRPENALAMSQNSKPGEVQWQISGSGSMEFSVRSTDGSRKVFSSARRLRSNWFGRWIHLAAVYDKSRMKVDLYLNGKWINSDPIVQAVPLALDTVELGNWEPAQGNLSRGERRQRQRPSVAFREVQGRMDEFALWSRPLSADEIRKLYETGKPREEQIVAK